MVKQNDQTPGRGGSIITMSSVNAVLAIPTAAGYNAAKGGVSSLTRCCPLQTTLSEAHVWPAESTCDEDRVLHSRWLRNEVPEDVR